MLVANEISKSFDGRKVLDRVSLQITKGEVIGLVGPNGAGKTTSFYIIVGLLKPDSGEISLDGTDITQLPLHKRAQQGLCYLPQNSSIFKKLTVEENLLCTIETLNLKKEERVALMETLFQKLSLNHIRKNYGYSLSGGERRRVEIARTLVLKPKFLLLDEPFAGIDPVTIQDIKKIISKLSDEGIGVLITDHNVRDALEICHRAYVISEGKVLSKGMVDTVLEDTKVREVYLGEDFKL